jgi:UDP-2,3-diacylglucosamine hydrolase
VFASYIPLLEKLRRLATNGTRLFFVEGNHDFNLGPYFRDTLNCTIIPDQQLIEWDGKKLLLCHGDLLNPDRNYQRLRSFWRSGLVRMLTRIIHPDLVWSFAIWLSDQSRNKHPENCHWDPSPLLLPFARQHFARGCDAVLCGHFHQIVNREIDGKQLIVVGDWIRQFSYVEMTDGRLELKSYPD